MQTPKHGEIWTVDFNPARGSEQAGLRPALIIQNNIGNRVSDTTIIAAFSTNLRPNPTISQSNKYDRVESGFDGKNVTIINSFKGSTIPTLGKG